MEGEQVIPVEVKYTAMKSPRLPSGLHSFIREYKPESAYMVTRDYFGKMEIDNGKDNGAAIPVMFVPAYLLP